MDKRYRLPKNAQAKAFELFNQRYTVFYVAKFLGITIAEARSYKELFQKADAVSPENSRDIRNFIESGWEKDRKESLELLANDLISKKREAKRNEKVRECLRRTLCVSDAINEIVALFENEDQVYHWIRNDTESLLVDRIKKLCFN